MLQQQFYKYQVNSVGNLLVLSVQFLLFWSVHDTLGITKKLQIAYTQYDRGTHISDAEIMTFLKLWKAAFVFWNNTLESENEMAVSSKVVGGRNLEGRQGWQFAHKSGNLEKKNQPLPKGQN